MTTLREAQVRLAGRMFDTQAIAVTYKRGVLTASVMAMVGRTQYEVITEESIAARHDSRDYLILRSSLNAFGEPQPGDYIVEGSYTGEVNNLGTQPAWHWSDADTRTVYRIHTKDVS